MRFGPSAGGAPPPDAGRQVVGEFAQAPPGERAAQLARRVVAVATMNASSSSLIRRGRPPAHRGSSARSPDPVERVDDIPHDVLIRGDQASDRRHRRPGRRRHNDQRSADPDRVVLAAPHELLQLAALGLGQPPCPYRLGHPRHPTSTLSRVSPHHRAAAHAVRRVPTRQTFMYNALVPELHEHALAGSRGWMLHWARAARLGLGIPQRTGGGKHGRREPP
jgi:hypothetical protein